MVFCELDLPTMQQAHLTLLNRPFTDEEIKRGMFAIGKCKSPGLDGYTTKFFQEHWI